MSENIPVSACRKESTS